MNQHEKKIIQEFDAGIEPKRVEFTLIKTSHRQSGLMEKFCEDFSKSAPSVKVKVERADDDSELPAIVVKDRLRFLGVPSNKELEPFLDVLKLSAEISEIKLTSLEKKLSDLSLAASFDIFISPSCPFCPATVKTLAPLAFASELLRVAVIDAEMFPDLAAEKGVRSVPMTFLDDAFSWTGAVEMNEIIDVVKHRDPSQLSADSLKDMIHQGLARNVAEMMEEKEAIFPGFLKLLIHEKWPVRLGAMVTVEELAARNRLVAEKLVEPVWNMFSDGGETVQGDLLYVIGEAGGENAVAGLKTVLERDYSAEVKEAAREAIDKIRMRPK